MHSSVARRLLLLSAILLYVSGHLSGTLSGNLWPADHQNHSAQGANDAREANDLDLTAAFPAERRGAIVGNWGGIASLAVASRPLVAGLSPTG